jgi:hypothetical protein
MQSRYCDGLSICLLNQLNFELFHDLSDCPMLICLKLSNMPKLSRPEIRSGASSWRATRSAVTSPTRTRSSSSSSSFTPRSRVSLAAALRCRPRSDRDVFHCADDLKRCIKCRFSAKEIWTHVFTRSAYTCTPAVIVATCRRVSRETFCLRLQS